MIVSLDLTQEGSDAEQCSPIERVEAEAGQTPQQVIANRTSFKLTGRRLLRYP